MINFSQDPYEEDKEEEKFEAQKNQYEEVLDPAMFQPPEFCVKCKNVFSKEDEQMHRKIFLQSTECFHEIHKKCFIDLILSDFSKEQVAKCPECQGNIMEFEINEYLNQEQREELDKQIMQNMVRGNPNLIQCSCGDIIELVQGQVDLKQKDNDGNPISKEAAVHMSKYRIRC